VKKVGVVVDLYNRSIAFNPLRNGIYRVVQIMAWGLWCHPLKDDISLIRDDSDGIFAPRQFLSVWIAAELEHWRLYRAEIEIKDVGQSLETYIFLLQHLYFLISDDH